MSVLSEKVSPDTIMAMAMADEIDKLRAENKRLCAENDFLHKRRGELVMDRDRYIAEVEKLRAELAKHQESEFHPDWSMLKATRNSLLEHQKMIRERDAEIEGLRASYTAIIQWLRGQGLLVRHSMCTRPDNTLGPAWVLRRVHSVAGDSCLGWDKDDPVAAVEAALKVTR